MIIVLDTNMLIYVIKHRIVDQLKEFRAELVVPSTVKKELQKFPLSVKEKAYAAAALELLKVWNVIVIDSDVKDVDKSVIGVAQKMKKKDKDTYVATSDKRLIKELFALGIKNIAVKRGKTLSKA